MLLSAALALFGPLQRTTAFLRLRLVNETLPRSEKTDFMVSVRLTIGGEAMGLGRIELRVRDGGEEILVYSFPSIDEAAEMFEFLRGFLPEASFLIQPQPH